MREWMKSFGMSAMGGMSNQRGMEEINSYVYLSHVPCLYKQKIAF